MNEEILTIREIANYLKIKEKSIYALARAEGSLASRLADHGVSGKVRLRSR